MAGNNEKENREFGVLLEHIDSNVKHIAEAVDTHTVQLNRLEDKMERVEVRLDSIENILETVNLPALKQKVVTLEKRIDMLEAKLKTS